MFNGVIMVDDRLIRFFKEKGFTIIIAKDNQLNIPKHIELKSLQSLLDKLIRGVELGDLNLYDPETDELLVVEEEDTKSWYTKATKEDLLKLEFELRHQYWNFEKYNEFLDRVREGWIYGDKWYSNYAYIAIPEHHYNKKDLSKFSKEKHYLFPLGLIILPDDKNREPIIKVEAKRCSPEECMECNYCIAMKFEKSRNQYRENLEKMRKIAKIIYQLSRDK